MNLLFSINKKYSSLLLTCMQSIANHGGYDQYVAYILHSDLSEQDQSSILMLMPTCFSCCFIYVDDEFFHGFPESNRYPVQIYYRLAAAQLLPQHIDRILYLDVDTIVINSLKELYTEPFREYLFMACTHTDAFLTRMNQYRLGTKKGVPYINTGVMLMNLTGMRKEIRIADIRNYAMKNKASLILPDQDILTALYGERVKLIDTMKYNLSDREITLNNADPRNPKVDQSWVQENAVIIHYYGSNRPWNPNYKGILGDLYLEAAKDVYEGKQSNGERMED